MSGYATAVLIVAVVVFAPRAVLALWEARYKMRAERKTVEAKPDV